MTRISIQKSVKEEVDFDTKDIRIEMRAAKNAIKGDYWPLARIIGGIDKMTIRQRQGKTGFKTIIEFVSLGGNALTEDYDRNQNRRDFAAGRLETKAPDIAPS